jgi:tyrosyl-tRNA synthetase
MKPVSEQLPLILRGSAEILTEQELGEKLQEGRPLRVKCGFDPTAPDLHLGHTVLIHKMRQFQELGHEVIFLIGDFTAIIGDPSGRSEIRPQLSRDEIEANARTYRGQIFKILDESKTRVEFNSSWMRKLAASDLIELATHSTVARMLEREDFRNRSRMQHPIGIHEFLYPLIQAYDSVALRADVELGGTDQKFNLLVGRELQRDYGQTPQVVLTMPLLEGLDGKTKMSKSLGNSIGIHEEPREIYGKLMSISDTLMIRYYDLLSDVNREGLEAIKCGRQSPLEAKKNLARELTGRFHGRVQAEKAERYFEDRFQLRQTPEEVRHVSIHTERIWVCRLMKETGLASSTSEARRLIAQKAVRVDGDLVTDANFELERGTHKVIEVGKKQPICLS